MYFFSTLSVPEEALMDCQRKKRDELLSSIEKYIEELEVENLLLKKENQTYRKRESILRD